jgi:hypothetical protein
MAAVGTETLPTTWDDERDSAFFTITARLFSTEFTFGAGVLLATYDVPVDAPAVTGSQPVAPNSLRLRGFIPAR